MELECQKACPGSWIITPRVEIIRSMIGDGTQSMRELLELGFERHITTPIRFRNRLMSGMNLSIPALIIDEAHHSSAETYQQLEILSGLCPVVGFTATPFRGTPQGTKLYREAWGEPVWAITYPEAVEEGYISLPTCKIEPLVDDDLIEIVNGEFNVVRLTSATMSKLDDIAKIVQVIDMPTMYALPNTQLCRELAARMKVPCDVITQASSYAERQRAFDNVVHCRSVLLQIAVVSEGVDLPIRRLVDCSPTMSPVKWLQLFGRITRKSNDVHPEYVCTNRNFLRHCYLLDGLAPVEAVKAATTLFPTSKRSNARSIGLESVGQFKANTFPLLNGMKGSLYLVSTVKDQTTVQYACICLPHVEETMWAMRVNEHIEYNAERNRIYGTWHECEAPDNLSGFATIKTSTISEAQRKWWVNSAARFGLDPKAEVTSRVFQILPILKDLRKSFRNI